MVNNMSTKLKDLTDSELQAKLSEYNLKHEMTEFAKFDRMIECIKRERARRFWDRYTRPSGRKSAAEVEARAAQIFHT
tara:strand:- start:193 stop:426 length:234 start_codon:yes stop_codon:yes gene_type:complete